MPLGVLVALDDFLFGNLGEGVTVSYPLHILDGLSGWLMNLPKADRLLCRNSGNESNGDQDEG
jgi:hypothetical protein